MRHQTIYIDNLEEIEVCGQKMFRFTGGTYELPYNIIKADGEHDLEKCQGCRTQYQSIIDDIKEQSKNFPDCCVWHRKLNQLNEFKKSDFLNLEANIADKILFTYHHVLNHFDNDDFFEDFANYYEYVLNSLGSFPETFGAPFQLTPFYSYLKNLISGQKGILVSEKLSTKEIDARLDLIIQHIDNSFRPTDQKIIPQDNKRDLNLLVSTYDRWFRTFPFNLSYFEHLKEKFSTTLPILNGNAKYNKYTGLSTFQLHTKESLTQFLIGLTHDIISNVNGLKLYENELLTNVENIKLELILKNRELELSELQSIDNTDRKGYIKALKFWFKSEKKFIEEITPILKDKEHAKVKMDLSKLSINQIALKLFYEGVIVSRENSNKIIKDYGHNSGDKLFNQYIYFSSLANRRGNPNEPTKRKFLNKIELFETVIELLPEDKKQRALDELSILKVNYDALFEQNL